MTRAARSPHTPPESRAFADWRSHYALEPRVQCEKLQILPALLSFRLSPPGTSSWVWSNAYCRCPRTVDWARYSETRLVILKLRGRLAHTGLQSALRNRCWCAKNDGSCGASSLRSGIAVAHWKLKTSTTSALSDRPVRVSSAPGSPLCRCMRQLVSDTRRTARSASLSFSRSSSGSSLTRLFGEHDSMRSRHRANASQSRCE